MNEIGILNFISLFCLFAATIIGIFVRFKHKDQVDSGKLSVDSYFRVMALYGISAVFGSASTAIGVYAVFKYEVVFLEVLFAAATAFMYGISASMMYNHFLALDGSSRELAESYLGLLKGMSIDDSKTYSVNGKNLVGELMNRHIEMFKNSDTECENVKNLTMTWFVNKKLVVQNKEII